MRPIRLALLPILALASCSGTGEAVEAGNAGASTQRGSGQPFRVEALGQFAEPWAMTFLPNGILLITEKKGTIRFVDLNSTSRRAGTVSGVPAVDYGGQGGLGDIVAHPDFGSNNLVYISYVEAGPNNTRGAAVARARLVLDEADAGRLEGLQVIWRQEPKVEGRGHFGHRIAFSPDGHMFISNGDRQKFDPAQDDGQTLGKIVRLTDAGGIPSTNPHYDKGNRILAQTWTKGHRNPLGIAFDSQGRLWNTEMGPKGGDEMNLIVKGANYGYPIVSNGDHYDGKPIPDHNTRPEFEAPKVSWTPVISPSSLIFYSGSKFPEWRGSALIGALSGKALVRVGIDGNSAREIERFDMGERIREVEQGPDGAVYLLEDQADGSGGRLLKLTPAR